MTVISRPGMYGAVSFEGVALSPRTSSPAPEPAPKVYHNHIIFRSVAPRWRNPNRHKKQ